MRTLRNHAGVTHAFQGKRERQRRLKQVRAGTLRGDVVSESARYASHGLVAPSDLTLIRPQGRR